MYKIEFVNDEKYFQLNGKNFPRIYQAISLGENSIGIYNIYDVRHQILSATPVDEVLVNGQSFTSREEIIDVLIPILFDNLGEDIRKNLTHINEVFEDISIGEIAKDFETKIEATSYYSNHSNSSILNNVKFSISNDGGNNGIWKWSNSASGNVEYISKQPIKDDEFSKFRGLVQTLNKIKNSHLINFNGQNELKIINNDANYSIEDSEYFGQQMRVSVPAGARFQMRAKFNALSGESYSGGFIYKSISGNINPYVYSPISLTSNIISSGVENSITIGEGWIVQSRENMVASTDYTDSGESFLIDINNTSGNQNCEFLIALPSLVVGSKYPISLFQNYDEYILDIFSKIGETNNAISGLENEFLDLNSILTNTLEVEDTPIEIYRRTSIANISAVLPLLDLERYKTYVIEFYSDASLPYGVEFYTNDSENGTQSVKFFEDSNDFSSGISWEYVTTDIEQNLQVRTRVTDVEYTCIISEVRKLSEPIEKARLNDTILNGITKLTVIKELNNYVAPRTATFDPFTISDYLGEKLSFEFNGNYTGRFSIYVYRSDGSYYQFYDVNNRNFNDGILFELTIPEDAERLEIRTYETGVIINYRVSIYKIKEIAIDSQQSQWKDKNIALYGDSITAISGGDFSYPYNDLNKWGTITANNLQAANLYGRGIGGQRYSWNNTGGAVSFIDATGNNVGRNDLYNYENYEGNVTVPAGTTPVRGAYPSWLRITTMFPQSIKSTIDAVIIKGGTNDDVNNTANLEWVENDTTDPEWANSTYYNKYNGDYNINSLKGGMASTIMKMQAWMPQALIIIATPLPGRASGRGDEGFIDPANFITQEYIKSEMIREVANIFSCQIIDVNANSGINGLNRDLYISDGVHPYSVDGNKMLGRVITGGMKGIMPIE
ncbi:SGNH/GDSL hydrolase family protein [Zunongwangia atlantica]|uniref:Uncharacterized protein n=1 Tax=Zunongwangia atlantica 22II14-10F7 TaxID=1185767 RepID=A0A1Y1T3S4_9FLAO|nr:hypothetical protein [Zunongwangia atlantica]ORL45392.1 hypothetical protein IIF7_11238 [Zunongwangia atlantica 22II14-10F7]